MEKPMILLAQDFKDELSNLVNTYINQVPAMFLADSVRDIYSQLDTISRTQLAQAREKYESGAEDTTE